MKKIITLFVAATLLAVCAFSFAVNGAEAPFTVEISGNKAVSAGDTVTYNVAVKDINIKPDVEGIPEGLGGVSIAVVFDTSFFDASTLSVTCPTIGAWTVKAVDANKADGKITLMAFDEFDNGVVGEAVKENGVIVFKISLKVKADAAEDSEPELYVDTTSGDTYGLDGVSDFIEEYESNSVNISLIKKLATPSDLSFDGGLAKWGAVEGASGYAVQLYKNGTALGGAVSVSGTSYDFTAVIDKNLGGSYTFTVSALASDTLYKDSDSATSSEYKYRGTLTAPSLKLEVIKESGKIKYTITDPNPEDSVNVYIIKVYDKDGNAEEIISSKLSDYITSLKPGEEYSVTVEASSSTVSNTETGNRSSGESEKKKVVADGIVGISVTKKPKLSYTEGNAFDLSALEITVDFAVAKDVKIGKDDLAKYGITVNPKHGTDLLLSMNGNKVTVTCGSLSASEELVLEIESSECRHGSTKSEHKDPTCTEEGYDAEVCALCGTTLASEPIPSLGGHTYGEWTWTAKPTVNIDGVRTHTCSACGESESEQVTYAEYLAMQAESTTPEPNTPPPTTNAPTDKETDAPVTTGGRKNNALGGVADIGKIFLFVLVGILLVIVIFIVAAVYMESRRNRRRKSRARTNQARNNRRR